MGAAKAIGAAGGRVLQVPAPALRIVSDDFWHTAHRRLQHAREDYERATRGKRRPHRDGDSKYLLPGFGRCALCRGGLHDLETVQREQARLAEAVAAGADVPVLVERLRVTDRRRQELTDAFNASKTRQAPAWDEIERRVRKSLADWRSLVTGDVSQARQGFRRLLTTPILFTPFVKNGRRGIRFEGRIGADALFGGMVTSGTSPTGTVDDCTVDATGRIAA